VLDADQLGDGTLVGTQAGTTPVLLVRRGDEVHALDDRCSHRGCALHEGELQGETVRCRCHGSTFRLDGSIVKGPATAPQPRFEVRLQDGTVEIRGSKL
jgi:nitrite reductase/ring-hydroxylating ferredoxin subunit